MLSTISEILIFTQRSMEGWAIGFLLLQTDRRKDGQ